MCESMSSTDKAAGVPLAQTAAEAAERSAQTAITWAVRAAEDRKAENLRVLDLSAVCDFADHFLIASGRNERQVQAITDRIQERLREAGEKPLTVEGYRTATWVLLDYGDLVIHVFQPEARSFYGLEKLWSDAEEITDRFAAPASPAAEG